MKRVLVSEQLADSGLEAMRAAGLEVDVRLGLSPSELLDAVRGASALVIRSATQVTAEVLEAGDELVVVGRAGIGLDNVDVEASTRRGVMVVNAPQSNVLSAAEHTIALLLAQARNVPQADRDLRNHQWNRTRWEGVELHNKTLGIVGLGRVGVLVAQRANAFGMQLAAYDPYVSADRARQLGVDLVPTVEELVQRADFLTIHLPKTPDTVGLISAELLAHAKPTLRIVNTARGGIVDEAALADAVRNGVIAGAALDVFAAEPTTESPLFELDSVVVTPHLGASTAEAQDKAGQTIAEQVVLALRGEFVPFAVNLAATEASATVQPFMPLAERLGPHVHRRGGWHRRHARDLVRGPDRRLRLPRAHAVGAQGRARSRRRRAGVVRQRAATRRGARAGGARDHFLVGARLREPDRAARAHQRTQHARRRHALRQAGRPAHRRHRRLHRRPAAVEPHAGRAQRRQARDGRAGRHHRSATTASTSTRWTSAGARRATCRSCCWPPPRRCRPRSSASCAATEGVVDARAIELD